MWIAETGDGEPVYVCYSFSFSLSLLPTAISSFIFFSEFIKYFSLPLVMHSLYSYMKIICTSAFCSCTGGLCLKFFQEFSTPLPWPLSVVHLTSPVESQQSTLLADGGNTLR